MLFNKISAKFEVAKFTVIEKIKEERGDAGIGFYLTIAASLIISAFVFIPGVRSFANGIVASLGTWWTNDIQTKIFPAA